MKHLSITKNGVYCLEPSSQSIKKMGVKIGNTLFKKVKREHFMRIIGGYGLQHLAFGEFDEAGIERIIIIEPTGNKLESNHKDWELHGKVANYGAGKQIFLSTKYMRAPTELPTRDEIPKL